MSTEDTNLENANLMEEFLDQHDYKEPTVGDIRKGIIVAITPQGVIVDLGLKRDGLVPSSDLSKLEPEEREALQINDEIPVYVTSTDAPDSLVVSIHMAQLNQDWIDAEALMESGKIMEGEVIGYNKGGAIIPFGRLRGFVPASHLSALSRGLNDRQRQQKLAKLRGEKVPVKVIEVDRRRRRLVFSQREAQKEWEDKRKAELLNELSEGDTLTGRVSGLRDFGIFVDLGGADGLVHISELAWYRIDHPREVVKVGDEIEVYVLNINAKTQRISLSRKRLLENPWSTVTARYNENQLIEGKITRIVDYGAFAEIEPGVEGLLHLSQLSRGQVDNARDVVSEGETHLLRIVNIDSDRQRIGLSLRAVNSHEQIEWMARKEAEADEEGSSEAAVPDEVEAISDETAVSTVNEVAVESEDNSDESTVVDEVAESNNEDAEAISAEEVADEVAENSSDEQAEATPDEDVETLAEEVVEGVAESSDEEAEAPADEEAETVEEVEKVEAEEVAEEEGGDVDTPADSNDESVESEDESE
ncbi:SSU ribosomal protein S1p [hydrothermal vent metagenome]|uniref:SSU ribosomal protein S1p n=1 Tax=hydrothermal vent metagenome TaxID=652676 RepID=A0A3B0VGN7_9ZZZZ